MPKNPSPRPSKKAILDVTVRFGFILCTSAAKEQSPSTGRAAFAAQRMQSIRENKKNGNGENLFSPVPFFVFGWPVDYSKSLLQSFVFISFMRK